MYRLGTVVFDFMMVKRLRYMNTADVQAFLATDKDKYSSDEDSLSKSNAVYAIPMDNTLCRPSVTRGWRNMKKKNISKLCFGDHLGFW